MTKKRKNFLPAARNGGQSGLTTVYGLGFIGALVYYLQGAYSLETILIALIKAVIWPVLIVFRLLQMLGL